ncbi:response regulator transcription factor [Methylobacterium sp. SyP6R]|uniref:response regulator transcription factor n=1 Tax=Methylobacterium sp. SyP6R TaxID=2718876 RepID=UPI001F029A67|nr:LuxR C-terminal-related transcriptional regulator [Methylobacterium sp. SyP6R]MCF4128694.1 LuxR C-terminal-related transcriptional regulator [Methylobacterium sp. SyP6R]
MVALKRSHPLSRNRSAIRFRPTRSAAPEDEAAAPTARECELIALIARGLPNKLIAHELGISPNTVRAHIGNIMRKYGLSNRTQIAMLLTPLLPAAVGQALRRR